MKRKHKNMIILALLVIIVIIGTMGFNKVRYNNLNEELNLVSITKYPTDNKVVAFRTIRDMKKELKTQKETYATNIENKKTIVNDHIANDLSDTDLTSTTEQVNAISSDVSTTEEYNSAMTSLNKIESDLNYSLFSADIKTYLEANFTKSELEHITIGLVDLENGTSYTYNSEMTYYSASTIKVPMAMYMYDLIASGEASLDDTLTYEQENYEAGTGVIQYEPVGTVYTLDELLTDMIVYSDNVATNMIKMEYFPNPDDMTKELEPYWGYCNLDNSTSRECSVTNHITSLQYLYDNSEDYQLLIDDMKNCYYKERIPAGVPSDVEVANKIGSYNAVVIDDAIVYAEKPYALSIAFEEIPDSDAKIAALSEEIYKAWDKYFVY